MKKFILILVSVSFFINANGQNALLENFKKNYKLYWNSAKFLLDQTQIDPLITKIIDVSLPKVAEKDIKGAIFEISNLLHREKNIKILAPQYTSFLDKEFNSLIDNIKKKKWGQVALILCDVALTTDEFLRTGNIENATDVEDLVPDDARKNIDKKIFVSRFNDYTFYYKTRNRAFVSLESLMRAQERKEQNKNNHRDLFGIIDPETNQEKYLFVVSKTESRYSKLKFLAEEFTYDNKDILTTEYVTINNNKYLKVVEVCNEDISFLEELNSQQKKTNLTEDEIADTLLLEAAAEEWNEEGLPKEKNTISTFYFHIKGDYVFLIAFWVKRDELLKHSLDFDTILNNFEFNE